MQMLYEAAKIEIGEIKEKIMSDGKAITSNSFINDLDRVAQARQEFAGHLFGMAEVIDAAEREAPAKLELEQPVENLTKTAQTLKDGVFRLLVLGDMKRGKSTFLNALLGEMVLPSDVNPCTAILTKLRYGRQSDATVFFNDGKPPQTMTLKEFWQRYTIPKDEAKHYEEQDIIAFPDVSYAEIKYPLEILEKGVEIIDSPGLNHTEQRNEMSLGYIQNSHAILFVLNATQQYTLGEERYLENYIHGKGLPVFFLVNMWDDIARRIFDPSDKVAVAQKEEEIRQLFRAKLAAHTTVNGQNLYNQRVFEISALNALRARLGREGYSWEASGFAAFMDTLTRFLTQERAVAEMQLARLTARNASQTVREKTSLQISMLSQSTAELKEKINAIQPEFDELTNIAKQFDEEIVEVRNKTADDASQSFKEYFLKLDQTFEADFTRYMPEINSLQFLRKNEREKFHDAIQQEFERYMQDRIADWSKTAEAKVQTSFAELSRKATRYAVSYVEATNRITAALTGKSLLRKIEKTQEELAEESPLWQRVLAGGVALIGQDYAAVGLAGAGIFNWKRILTNLAIVIGAKIAFTWATGFILGPLGAVLIGAGLGAYQLNEARKKFIATLKAELVKNLPTIAETGGEKVYEAIYKQFTDYELEVQKLIRTDIESRREQLNNLLKEREAHEFDIERETVRLQKMMRDVDERREMVETTFDKLLGGTVPQAAVAA
jgi:GTPase SAR1 family protein